MWVLFIDIYTTGTEINFDGKKHYPIGARFMTYFGIYKPTAEQNAYAFDSALMKIWMRFGFYRTIVVDKDSKFLGVFAQTDAMLGGKGNVIRPRSIQTDRQRR